MNLPILFFFEIHDEPATSETLLKLLPTLWEIGYRHVCSETDSGQPIENIIDLLQRDIASTDAMLRETEHLDLSKAPTELLAQLETYTAVTESSRIHLPLFKTIKSSKFEYHGIDLPSFLEDDAISNCKKVLDTEVNARRESYMTKHISELQSTLDGGLVVIMGLAHCKLAKKISPNKSFSAFHLYYDDRNVSAHYDATTRKPREETDMILINMAAENALKTLKEKLPVKHTAMWLLGSTIIDETLFFKPKNYIPKMVRKATHLHEPDPIIAIADEYLFAIRNGLPTKEWLSIEQDETPLKHTAYMP